MQSLESYINESWEVFTKLPEEVFRWQWSAGEFQTLSPSYYKFVLTIAGFLKDYVYVLLLWMMLLSVNLNMFNILKELSFK